MIGEIVHSFRRKGVRLEVRDGRLHYKALRGTIDPEDIETLRQSKSAIMSFLERSQGAEMTAASGMEQSQRYYFPLSFTQLARWHSYRLHERRSTRQVASAMRLRGRLDIDALRKAVTEIVRRHDALRTRIVLKNGIPFQETSESCDWLFSVDVPTEWPRRREEADISRLIHQFITEPIDLASAPLLGVRLVGLEPDHHLLIVAMDHMISDGTSLNILLRELSLAYSQIITGRNVALPTIPIQFTEFAVWQRATEESWRKKHGAYWQERLAGCSRLRFPVDPLASGETRVGWGTIPIRIESHMTAELRDWSRRKNTTLAMSLFAAYAAFVLRWCHSIEGVIRYQSDGRGSPDLEHTIGQFTTALYLRLRTDKNCTFLDVVTRAMNAYCEAYEHMDFSFLAAQSPRPEFTRNTIFNWMPQGPTVDISVLDGTPQALASSPVRFEDPLVRSLDIDNEPSILLLDAGDEILGDVYFPLSRFSRQGMHSFARSMVSFTEQLLRHPESRVWDIDIESTSA